MQSNPSESIWVKLFSNWELDAWANVLEIVGFTLSLAAFIISLVIKSAVNKLKTEILFEKRFKKHITNLTESASKINQYLNDYNNNKNEIKKELSLSISELQDLKEKLGYWEGRKTKKLICFIKSRREKEFADEKQVSTGYYFLTKHLKRIYETNIEDIWIIYNSLHEVIRQVQNIKENKTKSRS